MPVIALAGAAVGSLGAAGAVTTAAGGIMSGIGGAQGAAAQQGMSQARQQQAIADRDQAMKYAAPTAQEIQSIGDRINQQQRYQAVQEAGLQRDQKILDTLDPALAQAGQQAFNMMKGQEASILAPMKQQQTMQMNQMKAKLAAQLGPGWETSSAGQAAMQSMQADQAMGLQQAQMGAMNQVTQLLGFGSQARTGMINQERMGFETGSQMSASTLNSMNQIQQRQTNTFERMSGAVQSTAGNQFAGQAAGAKMMSEAGGAMVNAGQQAFAEGGGFKGLQGMNQPPSTQDAVAANTSFGGQRIS